LELLVWLISLLGWPVYNVKDGHEGLRLTVVGYIALLGS